jgi:ComF family protein
MEAQARVPDVYREALDPSLGAPPTRLAGRLRRLAVGCLGAAADLVYPPHCMGCGAALSGRRTVLCGDCAPKVAWIGPDCCRRCGDQVGRGLGPVELCPACLAQPPAHIAGACAVASYAEPLRGVILALKFGRNLQAVPLLARLLALRIRATGLSAGGKGPMALAPVPLHGQDSARRGFNQAEELALGIGRQLHLPVETKLLRKVRLTPPQATLTREARAENLRGAFAANAARCRRYASGCILLVDDVMTTGATVSECARTLRQAGVGEVRAAVLARG